MKILAVDDEPDSLRLLKFVLVKNGAKVYTAENAEQALQAVQEFRPDCIVSDISMPGQDGFELIRHIRSLPPSMGG